MIWPLFAAAVFGFVLVVFAVMSLLVEYLHRRRHSRRRRPGYITETTKNGTPHLHFGDRPAGRER